MCPLLLPTNDERTLESTHIGSPLSIHSSTLQSTARSDKSTFAI